MIIRVKDNSLFLLVGQIVLGDEKFQLGLGSLSDQALISAAKDPDNNWQVRQAAVNALKDRMAKWDDQALISAAKDHDSDVRQAAVNALKDRMAKWDDQALISAAKDPDNWQVRQAAVNALKDGNKIGILIRAMVDVDIT